MWVLLLGNKGFKRENGSSFGFCSSVFSWDEVCVHVRVRVRVCVCVCVLPVFVCLCCVCALTFDSSLS